MVSSYPHSVAKMSVAELRDFLFRAREDVFKDPKGGLSFDTDTLESMLKERFGEMKMCDVKYPRYYTIILTVVLLVDMLYRVHADKIVLWISGGSNYPEGGDLVISNGDIILRLLLLSVFIEYGYEVMRGNIGLETLLTHRESG